MSERRQTFYFVRVCVHDQSYHCLSLVLALSYDIRIREKRYLCALDLVEDEETGRPWQANPSEQHL